MTTAERLNQLRQRILHTLATTDDEAREHKCDLYAFRAGAFGAQLKIVAEEIYLLQRQIEAEEAASCKS